MPGFLPLLLLFLLFYRNPSHNWRFLTVKMMMAMTEMETMAMMPPKRLVMMMLNMM